MYTMQNDAIFYAVLCSLHIKSYAVMEMYNLQKDGK